MSHAGLEWNATLDGEIDLWMGVENGKKLGLAEKFEINIYMYIYIYIYIYVYIYIYIYICIFNFPTYLYFDSITYIIPQCSE